MHMKFGVESLTSEVACVEGSRSPTQRSFFNFDLTSYHDRAKFTKGVSDNAELFFQAQSLLIAPYIIIPSNRPVHSRTSTPWGAYSRAAVRDQRYRLHNHKCHHYQLGTPLTPGLGEV
jgi:hypothetical protein